MNWGNIHEQVAHILGMTEAEMEQSGYTSSYNFFYLANQCLSSIANSVRPCVKTVEVTADGGVHKMPPDFITFSDYGNLYYPSEDSNPELNPRLIYINDYEILVPKTKGKYVIQYEGLYPEITESFDTTIEAYKYIPDAVLRLIPMYIAYNVIMNDDATMGTIIKNDYEVACQRISTNNFLQEMHFSDEGGWI